MKVLVWQWGRHGAGPLVADAMARGLAALPGVTAVLSLSTEAERLSLPDAPVNGLPMRTYRHRAGFAARMALGPLLSARLARSVRAARVDVALCAMPAPMDLVMAGALRRARVPFGVVVHDAQLHPGDSFALQMPLQRLLLRRAGVLFALTGHVGTLLAAQPGLSSRPVVQASLPPFVFGPPPPPPGQHGGPVRLLSFGRLLPYKGLDLLADAMQRLGPQTGLVLRVVGTGPESPDLARLRALPHVTVENRWVPEAELGALLAWADALVLTHREASQSGVAASAIAARRWIVSTRAGGLAEQLQDEPMALLCPADPAGIAAALATLPARIATTPPPGPPSGWTASARTVAAALGTLCGAAAHPPEPAPGPHTGAAEAGLSRVSSANGS